MSGEKAPRKQSFLQGVAVLTAATIIVKLLGFIYKVPCKTFCRSGASAISTRPMTCTTSC